MQERIQSLEAGAAEAPRCVCTPQASAVLLGVPPRLPEAEAVFLFNEKPQLVLPYKQQSAQRVLEQACASPTHTGLEPAGS